MSKRCDFSTRALERTRPGERPPARWTARTVPRFSSMTPPSMHSSLLRILCICGTGCTSESQRGPTWRLHGARTAQHTVTGGSRFHLDALCNEVRRACTTPVCLAAIAASENRSLGFDQRAAHLQSISRASIKGRFLKPTLTSISALRTYKERGQPGGARTSSDAKEEKRSDSARFKNAKEEKRNKSARFKKSSEEIGAKGLQKVLNTADTDRQQILPHRAYGTSFLRPTRI